MEAEAQRRSSDVFGSLADLGEEELAELAAPVERREWATDELALPTGGLGASGWNGQPCGWMIADIASQEEKAERSLMHRFNIASVRAVALLFCWKP